MKGSTMNTSTYSKPSNAPQVLSARATCHVAGDEAGSIRIDCQLEGDYTAQDIHNHLQLMLSGEVAPLTPREVVQENDRFVVGFFSSDVANSGHLPATCRAVWQSDDEKEKAETLTEVAVQSAAKAKLSGEPGASEVPGGNTAQYPRTVGNAAMLALLVGGALTAATILLLM